MQLRVANHLLMCSTLVLGKLPRGYMDHVSLTSFKKGLREAVEEAENPETVEKRYSLWGPENYEEVQVLHGEPVENFAFIVASTEPIDSWDDEDDQVESEKMMEKLGFKKMFRETTYNEKNETDISLWCIRVSDFLEAIKE